MVEPLTDAELKELRQIFDSSGSALRGKREVRNAIQQRIREGLSNEETGELLQQVLNYEKTEGFVNRPIIEENFYDLYKKVLTKLSNSGIRYKNQRLDKLEKDETLNWESSEFSRQQTSKGKALTKAQISKYFDNGGLGESVRSLGSFDSKLKTAIEFLIARIPSLSSKRVVDAVFTAAALPFKDYFSPGNRLSEKNRKLIYAEYSKIDEKFDKLPDILAKISRRAKDDEMKNIVKEMQKLASGNSLNFFQTFEEKNIDVFDIEQVGDNIAKLMVEEMLAVSEIFDDYDNSEEEFALEDEDESQEGIGEDPEAEEDDDSGGPTQDNQASVEGVKYADDILDEAEETYEAEFYVSLDPLSIIYFENINKKLAGVLLRKTIKTGLGDDVDVWTDTTEELSIKLTNSFITPLLESIGDKSLVKEANIKLQRKLNYLLDQVSIIEDSNQGDVRLPYHFANLGSLRKHYSSQESKSSSVEFLDLCAKLLYETPPKGAIRSRRNTGGRIGEPTSYGISLDPKEGKEYTERRAADLKIIQAGLSGKEREGLDASLQNAFDELKKFIEDVYVKVQDIGSGFNLEYEFTGHPITSGSKNTYSGKIRENVQKYSTTLIRPAYLNSMSKFLSKFKELGESFTWKPLNESAEEFFTALMSIYGIKQSSPLGKEAANDVASLLGALIMSSEGDKSNKQTYKFKGIPVLEAYEKRGVDHPNEIKSLNVLIRTMNRERYVIRNADAEKAFDDLLDLINSFNLVLKNDVTSKLLKAHDEIRLLKGQDVYRSYLCLDSFDDICKMQDHLQEQNLDLSALEINNICKEADSFKSIGNEYGISSEMVYYIKSHFR